MIQLKRFGKESGDGLVSLPFSSSQKTLTPDSSDDPECTASTGSHFLPLQEIKEPSTIPGHSPQACST